MEYTFNEQTGMLLVLGFYTGNCRESVQVYHERFLNQHIPKHQTFAFIERRLGETGQLKPNRNNAGRPCQSRTPATEDVIPEIVENPGISTR